MDIHARVFGNENLEVGDRDDSESEVSVLDQLLDSEVNFQTSNGDFSETPRVEITN